MATIFPPYVAEVLTAVAAIVSGLVAWQNARIKRVANANHVQLEQWLALATEWRKEIDDCREERDDLKGDRERLRVELSSLKTLVVALRKVHEGEFPSLPELQREISKPVTE